MKQVLTISILFGWLLANAQPVTGTFTGNNFRWNQNANGALFYNYEEGLPGLEVPINQGIHSVFISTFWFGGMDTQTETPRINTYIFRPNEAIIEDWGPVRVDGFVNNSSEVIQYNKIWFVTAEMVLAHQEYFACLQDPLCDESIEFPNGYQIPSDFLSWPAHGDTLQGHSFYLAPFVDHDNDGLYNPNNGDHPNFCGHFATYVITNDIGTENNPPDTLNINIGIEIHTQIYGYEAAAGSLFNTLFVQQKVINRGNKTLSNSYMASWVDFDIGNFDDDRIATDVQRSMFYGYNGDNFDEGSTSGPGYGEDLGAMGVRVLAGAKADADEIDNPRISSQFETYANQTAGYEDDIIDNERLGLYSSIYHNNATGPTPTQDPQAPIHFLNYMRGTWRNGVPLIYGGTGFSPGGPIPTLARYMFPGDSDPLLEGTNGIDPNYPFEGGWTEENEDFQPSDRRMLGSSGPFTFAPGDEQYLDYAYIFARESFDENETVIETLQRYADEIAGMECGQLPSISLSTKFEEASKLGIEIFPNPAQNLVNFRFAEPYQNIEIEIRDLNGRLVSHNRYGLINQIEQELNFAPGVYIVRVFADDKVGTSKLVITE